MDEQKQEGFRGERLVVLPTEAFAAYAENPLVKRLFLTDVGFFSKARHHYRHRAEGIDHYIFFYCTEGNGIIQVEDKECRLNANEAFCIPRFCRHCYFTNEETPWSILWVHFRGKHEGKKQRFG